MNRSIQASTTYLGKDMFKDTDFLQPFTYTLQDSGGWYSKDADMGCEPAEHLLNMPTNLQIQHVFKQGIKSNQILTSGNQTENGQLFTGLRQTNEQDWLYGDIPQHIENRVFQTFSNDKGV